MIWYFSSSLKNLKQLWKENKIITANIKTPTRNGDAWYIKSQSFSYMEKAPMNYNMMLQVECEI